MLNEVPVWFALICLLLGFYVGLMGRKADRFLLQDLEQEKADLQANLEDVYHQRNMLAMALAKYSIELGLQAGIGIDPDETPDWCHVLFIDMPDGGQISYHLAPHEVDQFQNQLPAYTKPWDGTGKEEHHRLIEAL
ncbi:hypothetical protein [Deinococcus cellulosilyticus]|uniref:Uncharacterized protein n=1 Tax=Deinococcus cellulosilyticus (strain DSM 18568 / NBRC 106333 / KACC 11606 / 5516J-15) TaxID=1223518 RepID=A0A511MXL5_DEIC1|nr:hypothetical protein [Deinococcus cellulosilyticus]GEM45323.1 hypothetical protein DC3_09580 [Deinococcus cellulosilyticus NBRC 106333 = KACC 11606]